MKRHWEIVLLILAMALWPLSRLAAAQELEKLDIGHSNLRNDIAALWVPKDLGIFRKNGLGANIVLITGGQRMTQALLSSSAALGFTGATPVVIAVNGGADTVMILGKATIEIMGSRNPKIARLKPQDVLDTSILARLEQSGSIRSESAK